MTKSPEVVVKITRGDGKAPDIEMSGQVQKQWEVYKADLEKIGDIEGPRAHQAMECMRKILLALKAQPEMTVNEFKRIGGYDALYFIQCIEQGWDHPLFKLWQTHRAKNRNPDGGIDRLIKGIAVIGVLALEKIPNVGKGRACELAADAVNRAKVFKRRCTGGAIQKTWIKDHDWDPSVIAHVEKLRGKSEQQVRDWITDKVKAVGDSRAQYA